MKRLLLAACLAFVVAGCAACGGGGDEPPGTRVSPKGVPFTFVVPDEFRNRRVRGSFSRGAPPLAVYALDPWNLVDVRRSAPSEIPLDRVAEQIGGSLKGLGFANPRGTRVKRGGHEFVVFQVVNRIGGRQTASRLYFFTGAGATWEIECQSTADRTQQTTNACNGAVRSIKFP